MKEEPKKIGTIKWHQWHIDRLRETHKRAGKARGKERSAKHKAKIKKGYHVTVRDKTKKPAPRYRSRVDYDFLKYIRVVFKWATDNYPELSKPEIELLLYLYGTGAFSKKQFNDYHKLLGLYSIKTLKKFEEGGWIKLWRNRKGREHALYTLTHKAKLMCNKMHRYSCGVEEIPDNPVGNQMMRADAPRINNYYMDIIKRMNKDKAPE